MITMEVLRRAGEMLGELSADHPVIFAHARLQEAMSAHVAGRASIDELTAVAVESARAVADFEPLWAVLEELVRHWDYRDDQLARSLLERDLSGLADAEGEVLAAAGLSPEIATLIILTAFASSALTDGQQEPTNVGAAPAVLRNLADELENARTEAELQDVHEEAQERSRDRRLRYKLKRIGRIIHVTGGGVLVLADVSANVVALIANPLVLVGTGALSIVSIGKGVDLMKTGISPNFADK